jgi:hypothetical protein
MFFNSVIPAPVLTGIDSRRNPGSFEVFKTLRFARFETGGPVYDPENL